VRQRAQVQRCCLKKEQPSGAYTSGERDSALKSYALAARSEFDQKAQGGAGTFLGRLDFRKSPMKN